MMLTEGTRLGRFEILAPLGKGGMGEVYRAKDPQLGREVAIKILPERLAQDAGARKRFEKEARVVASLSHPNILSLHDSGTDQGVVYAVMELLDGETLRSRLLSSPIPLQKALEITAAVTTGLVAAHAKGVIHRDLKPDNIFLTKDGRIKILDFGLAQWTPTPSSGELGSAVATESEMTAPGIVMGTLPYMSPEQVRGEPLDARSDIFSMGSILYEMLAGARPFSGNTGAEVVAAILKDQPRMPPGIPLEVQRILERCLAKDPEQRFHSAHDLAFAFNDLLSAPAAVSSLPSSAPRGVPLRIRWLLAAIVAAVAIAAGWRWIGSQRKAPEEMPTRIESLAVLPLQNLSGDAKQEYFADGMTEELIAKLARISSLRVISRTSVMEYKNAHKPLPQIAKELNVDAVIEGSVLQAGTHVRITAQLIYAPTDRHLWADSYEGDLRDIFTLQNDVATSIAREIQAKVAPAEAAQLASAPQVNPEAYQAYLRGLNYAHGQISEENVRLSVEMFRKAVALDPGFALAYAELSRAEGFQYFIIDHTPDNLARSKAALDRAFQLKPDLPEGHIALGYYYYRGFRDYDRALKELRTAEKSLPNNMVILEGEATIYRRKGDFEKALTVQQKLIALNPRAAGPANDIGYTCAMLRRYEDAERYFGLAISLAPDEETGYLNYALNRARWKGDVKGAREALNKCPVRKSPVFATLDFLACLWARNYRAALDAASSPYQQGLTKPLTVGFAYRYLNQPDASRTSLLKARDQFERALQEAPDDPDLHSYLGLACAALGLKEEAIREGKRAVELLPVSKDGVWGPEQLQFLAHIYTLLGEEDAAIDQLQYLLSIPSLMSVQILRIEPRWDPLRRNPRFQKLVEAGS